MAKPTTLTEPSRAVTTVDVSAIENISRAEIDQQIATAHRYPRSLSDFLNLSRAMIQSDPAVADECLYALKRTDKQGKAKIITGPSIRFAEIIQYAWGNIRTIARVMHEGPRFITAQAVCHDLERNAATATEVQRRITGSSGNRYGDDMIGVTANAAASIARRNAILQVIPKPIWLPVFRTAEATVRGYYANLPGARDDAVGYLTKRGIEEEVIFDHLGVATVDEITPEHLVVLRAAVKGAEEKEYTLEEFFYTEAVTLQGVERVDLGAKLREGTAKVVDREEKPTVVEAKPDASGKGGDVQAKDAAGDAGGAASQQEPADSGTAADTSLPEDAVKPRAARKDRKGAGADPAPAGKSAGPGFTTEERALIDEFTEAMNEAEDPVQVDVAAAQFEGAFDTARPAVQMVLAKLQVERRTQTEASTKAGAKKLL